MLAKTLCKLSETIFIMTKQWVERNDHVSGWVYLIEAENFHGWVPGCALKRVKIGLTRSVENRLDTLHSSQPPCNYKVVKAIYVADMAQIEGLLHKQFKGQNVKLIKSREWHDLLPHQYARILWLFSRYDSKHVQKMSPKMVVAGLIALIGIGLLIGSPLRQTQAPNGMVEVEVERNN